MRIEIAIPEIKNVVAKYCSNLECDGTTNLLAYYLSEIGLEYKCFIGSVYFKESKFEPHVWLESEDYIIDFKTKMWLGHEALEGIFTKIELKKSDMSYMKGREIKPNLSGGKMLMMLAQEQFTKQIYKYPEKP